MDLYHAGDEVEITFKEAPGKVKRVRVCRSASDESSGFNPETAEYRDGWLEISMEDCSDPELIQLVMLGSDFHYYLGGHKVTLTRI